MHVRAALSHPQLQVIAAKGCFSNSKANGHGLSIATAGVARGFTVTVYVRRALAALINCNILAGTTASGTCGQRAATLQ